MVSPLVLVLLALGLSYTLSEIFKKIGLPRVTGQICAGLILGIGVIRNLVSSQENIQFMSTLASLGIILLFYYIGLEISLKTFSKNINKALSISVLKTVLPFVFGFTAANYLFGLSKTASAIVGLVLAVNALAVSADLLEELNLIKTKFGKLIVTTGAVDDLFYLFVMVFVFSLFHTTIESITILNLIVNTFIFLMIVVFARIVFVPRALKYFDREKSSTARFTAAMIVLFLMAALADFLSLGALIGAMVAGMVVRQTIMKDSEIPLRDEKDIAKSLHIIAFGFLIPIFFVWVGFNVRLPLIVQNISFILILTFISIVATVAGTIIAILLNRGSLLEGALAGFNLSAKGDVDLVIATWALGAAIISSAIFSSIVVISLLATIIAPVIFKNIYEKYGKNEIK